MQLHLRSEKKRIRQKKNKTERDHVKLHLFLSGLVDARASMANIVRSYSEV